MSETGQRKAMIDVSLEGLEVGLSGAIPEREKWTELAMDRGILEFIALLSGLIFKYGGRVVHGCHPSFTPIILRQARLHSAKTVRPPVTLVMSDLWYVDYPTDEIQSMTDVAELIVTKKIGNGTYADLKTRNDSLTAMRKVLIAAQNIMVAVGGKMHDKDGANPGLAEEMALAEKHKIPRYLIGGLGGYSQKLAMELTPRSLGNELSIEENVELFGTDDVSSCVNIVFKNLCQNYWKNNNCIQLPPVSFTEVEEFINTKVSRREEKSLVGLASVEMQHFAENLNELSLRTISLEGHWAKISNIVGSIIEITNQTNILIFNAAIDVARAGEQGQGFAVGANKTTVDSLLTAGNIALESAERIAALNLESARWVLEDFASYVKDLMGAKDGKEAGALHVYMVQASVEKFIAYDRSVYEISARTQEQLAKMIEDQFGDFQKGITGMLERAANSAPSGSNIAIAVAAAQGAIAAANAAFSTMRRPPTQVADSTGAAIGDTTKGTKKA